MRISQFQISTIVILLIIFGFTGLLWLTAPPATSGAKYLRESYSRLPESQKMATRAFVAEIALANPGDFLVRKDGRVLMIKATSKDYGGYLELRVYDSPRMETHFILREFVVWGVIDRFVKQSDPDAGAMALKFLSQ